MKQLEYTGKATFPLTIPLPRYAGAVPVTRAQAVAIAGADALRSGERRFAIETVGPWGVCAKVSAPVMSSVWSDAWPKPKESVTFYGERAGASPREEGYCLRCRVSVGRAKKRAFTSSVLLEIADPQPDDRRLVSVAILHI